MAVYRFRIVFEDHEDVVREIDITGKQNYEDLHRTIQEAIGFDNMKEASFFVSDDLWRKGQELALNPKPLDDDDDDDRPSSRKKVVKKMSATRIAEYVDDPHQRFVYEYDPAARWTLYMELMKIVPDDPNVNYPKCTKSTGVAPKQYKQNIVPPVVDDEDLEDDEDDKKIKNKVFTAEEEFDHEEHTGGTEDGDPDEPSTSEESEEGEEGSEEDAGEDYGGGDFGSEGDDF